MTERARNWIVAVTILIYFTPFACADDSVKTRCEPLIQKHRTGVLTIKTKPGASVTVRQLRHEFQFGTAVSSGMFRQGLYGRDEATARNISIYKSVLVENFNAAVHENALKWYATERDSGGNPDYSVADSILVFCEAHGIAMRGHCIYWGIEKFVQGWTKKLDTTSLRRNVERRGREVTARYRGRIPEYDLNNEMVHGDYYRDRLGDSITAEMFDWAKVGDPDVVLYLNDYSILSGRDLDVYLKQIREYLALGIPVGGIGVQGHFQKDIDINIVQTALDSLAQFNLPVKVTEYDLTVDDEEKKAELLDSFYRTCFAHPAVDAIVMWGFWEGAHWRPGAALWKKDWTPTPAAHAYRNLVFDEWWTSADRKAGPDGVCTVRAFYGTYLVTAGNAETMVTFSKNEGAKTLFLGL
ncbi:endo-1,4-beta-xylanase [Candidatus Omnitrophota bacterium]